MNKLLAILFNTSQDRDKLKINLDIDPKVSFWFYSGLPYTMFIKTEYTTKEISDRIDEIYGKGNHLVLEVTSNYWGTLSKELWEHFPDVNPK